MQAWLLPSLTGVESMKLGEAPEPTAGPGEIVVDVQFAALNPADYYLALNQYPAKPPLPHILGRDGVGTVRAIGPGVTGVQPGDTRLLIRSDVGVSRPGTLAQRVAVAAESTAPVPEGWSFEQAAAAPLVYITAWQALTQWPDLPAPSTVLVTGASGGVGVATTQLAHALGHRVMGLSRSKEKAEKLRTLGAAAVYDPTDAAWRKRVKEDFPDRVDLAVDNVAGESFNHLLEVMGDRGRISCVGRLAGPVPSFNTGSLFFRRLKIGGVAIGHYTPAESLAVWRQVLLTLAKTGARPVIDRVFPFEQVPAAFSRLKEGPMGKVVIACGGLTPAAGSGV